MLRGDKMKIVSTLTNQTFWFAAKVRDLTTVPIWPLYQSDHLTKYLTTAKAANKFAALAVNS